MSVNKMYEIRSGYPQSDGVPSYAFITMGLLENSGICGWHSSYCKDVYYSVDCDSSLAREISKQDLTERIQELLSDPSYSITFFGKKILSQWNAPLFQSLYFSNEYLGEVTPSSDSIVDKINTSLYDSVLTFCDRIHFIVYAGILFYFLFKVNSKDCILDYMLAVGIIGGFFFSIMWEAKARYILPYYITMFPLTIAGYQRLIEKFNELKVTLTLFASRKSTKSNAQFSALPFTPKIDNGDT